MFTQRDWMKRLIATSVVTYYSDDLRLKIAGRSKDQPWTKGIDLHKTSSQV